MCYDDVFYGPLLTCGADEKGNAGRELTVKTNGMGIGSR